MGSIALPQALFVIPRNPTKCNLPKLEFSACVSKIHPQLNVSSFCASGLRSSNLRSRSFVVKAEDESQEELVAEVEDETQEEPVAAEGEGEGDGEAAVAIATEERTPFKPRFKLGDIMGILNRQAIEASDTARPTPDIRTGDVVEIKLEVPENRKRLSIYKGIVISKQNAGIHTTIRIRRIIAGIGVEIVFPVYSPNIKEIRVVTHRKVRRARLYYLRDKLPRLSTFK